jgi:hypothetical protein
MGGVEDDAKLRTAFSKSAQESDGVCSAGKTDREAESRAEKRRLDGHCCAHERMIEHPNDAELSLVTSKARATDEDLSAETLFNSLRLEKTAPCWGSVFALRAEVFNQSAFFILAGC